MGLFCCCYVLTCVAAVVVVVVMSDRSLERCGSVTACLHRCRTAGSSGTTPTRGPRCSTCSSRVCPLAVSHWWQAASGMGLASKYSVCSLNLCRFGWMPNRTKHIHYIRLFQVCRSCLRTMPKNWPFIWLRAGSEPTGRRLTRTTPCLRR